jgi:hypothetical protein
VVSAAIPCRAASTLALMTLALLLGGAAPAEATFPGTPGKIAFTSGDIFVMNADGSDLVNITDTPSIDEVAPKGLSR